MWAFSLLQRSHPMPLAISKPSKTDEGGRNGHNQQGHEEGLGLWDEEAWSSTCNGLLPMRYIFSLKLSSTGPRERGATGEKEVVKVEKKIMKVHCCLETSRVSVTRFGEISTLWQYLNFFTIFESLFSVWHSYEPTWANFQWHWANYHWCKLPNIEK